VQPNASRISGECQHAGYNVLDGDRAVGCIYLVDSDHGREKWAEWCRNRLLALGCRDPVERIDSVKADDPHRRWIVEVFQTWDAHHGEQPIKAADLAEPVRNLVDPQRRGRQFVAARLTQLVGTRAGGFGLTRQEATGKWGAATYALRRTGSASVGA
jgi:hypothetical protein